MSSSIEINNTLAVKLETKIRRKKQADEARQDSKSTTIFRVLRSSSVYDGIYDPRMVSIGPYHRLRDKLSETQDQKLRLLGKFLDRRRDFPVQGYINELQLIIKQVGQSYSQPINLHKDEERWIVTPTTVSRGPYSEPIRLFESDFIEMLLLDGCFILELFMGWVEGRPDVLFVEGRGPTTIFYDLLLSENQIPLFVIEALFGKVKCCDMHNNTNNRNKFLTDLLKFLMHEVPSHKPPETWPENIHHLLDLYHHSLIHGLCQEQRNNDVTALSIRVQGLNHCIMPRPNQQGAERSPRRIPSATELYKVGVKFRKSLRPKNLFDVKFKGGIFEIPLQQINTNTKVLLANLVELERHKNWKDQIVTSYLAVMDSLIKRKEDVALLQHAGIIDNMLSTDQEAMDFLCQLRDRTSFDSMNHHFVELFRNVQLYYDSDYNRNRATLIRGHCNSPWAVISVIAGVVLLCLSALQTFYTVYPYYRPNP